jgi:hypothetical protein
VRAAREPRLFRAPPILGGLLPMSSKIRILAVRARRRFAGKRTTMRKALSCSPIFSVTPLARIGRRPRRAGSPRLEQMTDLRTSRHRRAPRRAVRVHGGPERRAQSGAIPRSSASRHDDAGARTEPGVLSWRDNPARLPGDCRRTGTQTRRLRGEPLGLKATVSSGGFL